MSLDVPPDFSTGQVSEGFGNHRCNGFCFQVGSLSLFPRPGVDQSTLGFWKLLLVDISLVLSQNMELVVGFSVAHLFACVRSFFLFEHG